jgi:hypothetical protein
MVYVVAVAKLAVIEHVCRCAFWIILDRRGSSRRRLYFHISDWKNTVNFACSHFSEVAPALLTLHMASLVLLLFFAGRNAGRPP